MPKIPTFTAEGSAEQLAGTTSNIKINPDANIFTALKPVTNAVVNFKIKENDAQNKTEALKLENEGLMKCYGFDGSDQYRYARIF